MSLRHTRRLVIPATLSWLVGCSSEPRIDATTDVPTMTDLREVAVDAERPDQTVVPDVPEPPADRADVSVAMDLVEPDHDDGIRCTDPRISDGGVPLCGYCSYPDGAPLGCARCPDGGDAGKLSLC